MQICGDYSVKVETFAILNIDYMFMHKRKWNVYGKSKLNWLWDFLIRPKKKEVYLSFLEPKTLSVIHFFCPKKKKKAEKLSENLK